MKFKFLTNKSTRVGETSVYLLKSIDVDIDCIGLTYDQAYTKAKAQATFRFLSEEEKIIAGFCDHTMAELMEAFKDV